MRTFWLAALAGCAFAAQGVEYRLNSSGRVDLGSGITLRAVAYPRNWTGPSLESVGYDTPDTDVGTVGWQLKAGGRVYGQGHTTLLKLAGGDAYVRLSVTMREDFAAESMVCAIGVPTRLLKGGAFADAKGAKGRFPEKFGELFVYSGTPGRFDFELPGAGCRKLSFGLARGAYMMVQDDRRWGDTFTFRITMGGRELKAGSSYETAFRIGGEDAKIAYAEPHVVKAGADWLPLDYRKEVKAGSAADLSAFPYRDGPAGKYGWLRNDNGHFVFADRPGEPQRFWGANFCGEGTCPSHADAERIVARFARAGYNTMRIHHYERCFVKGSDDRLTLNPEMMDRFDYFFAKAKERGIYVTTDVYVSRPVLWRDIGIDREGAVDMSLVKGLFLTHEPAFENWKAFARNLFLHVNPYTGLKYADDPAMPFVSLVNEGVFAWRRGVFDEDSTRAAWKAWLAAERAADPKAHPKAPADCLGCSINDSKLPYHWDLMQFMSAMEARFAVRARDYLRSLGVKALLTDWNCGPYPVAGAITNSLDYIDMHFYVDHPEFLGERWRLPVRIGNSNPAQARGALAVWCGKTARAAKMPYTISEWNFTAPNACRGAAGLLTGACAARLDWSALWRFDYIGSGSDLNDGATALSFFSIMADPFQMASDRAGVLLFRQRELEPIAADAEYAFPLAVEKGTGRFTVVTAGTAGGFGLAGDTLKAGPLECRLGQAPSATVWVSAVDGRPIASSSRLLLTHLTDLKSEGIRFLDDSCKILCGWGGKDLIVRRGTAEVALALDDPKGYAVWKLETDGSRAERVSAAVENGRLVFAADVRGGDGKAHYLYEITRK